MFLDFNQQLSFIYEIFVDSGATKHICSVARAFIHFKSFSNATTITLPYHDQVSVAFSGDVQLGPTLVLKDVLFVPQFKFNLLSVSTLTSNLIASDQTVIVNFFS